MGKRSSDDAEARRKRRAERKARKAAQKEVSSKISDTSDDTPVPKKTKAAPAAAAKTPVDIKRMSAIAESVIDRVNTKVIKKNSEYEASMHRLSDEASLNTDDVISFGIPWLDNITGGGAIFGRIVEIFGWEGLGKTALWENAAANCVQKGGLVVVFETEAAIDRKRLRKKLLEQTDVFAHLGTPTLETWEEKRKEDPEFPDPLDVIVYSNSDTAEQIFDEMEEIVDTVKADDPDLPLFIVWDSVAATSSLVEMDASVSEQKYSKQALTISKAMRKLRRKLSKSKVALCFVNQLRSKISDNSYNKGSNDYETFGGKAIRFYADVRINLTLAGKVIDDKKGGASADDSDAAKKRAKANRRVDGIMIQAETVKCKILGYPPFQKARFPIMFYEHGISAERSAMEYLVAKKKIKTSGGYSYVEGIEEGFYKKDWVEFYSANTEEIQDIIFALSNE